MTTKRKYQDRKQQFRELLKAHPLGLSEEAIYRIAYETDGCITRHGVSVSLRGMADAYVVRWVPSRTRMKFVAVWAVVDVPEDAPYPATKPPTRADYSKVIRK